MCQQIDEWYKYKTIINIAATLFYLTLILQTMYLIFQKLVISINVTMEEQIIMFHWSEEILHVLVHIAHDKTKSAIKFNL